MREKLLAAAAIGALLVAPAVAQTTDDTTPMTEEERQGLQRTFEGAGFTNFREVRDGVFEVTTSDGRTLIISRGAAGGGTQESPTGDTVGAGGEADPAPTTDPAGASEESPSQ